MKAVLEIFVHTLGYKSASEKTLHSMDLVFRGDVSIPCLPAPGTFVFFEGGGSIFSDGNGRKVERVDFLALKGVLTPVIMLENYSLDHYTDDMELIKDAVRRVKEDFKSLSEIEKIGFHLHDTMEHDSPQNWGWREHNPGHWVHGK